MQLRPAGAQKEIENKRRVTSTDSRVKESSEGRGGKSKKKRQKELIEGENANGTANISPPEDSQLHKITPLHNGKNHAGQKALGKS